MKIINTKKVAEAVQQTFEIKFERSTDPVIYSYNKETDTEKTRISIAGYRITMIHYKNIDGSINQWNPVASDEIYPSDYKTTQEIIDATISAITTVIPALAAKHRDKQIDSILEDNESTNEEYLIVLPKKVKNEITPVVKFSVGDICCLQGYRFEVTKLTDRQIQIFPCAGQELLHERSYWLRLNKDGYYKNSYGVLSKV